MSAFRSILVFNLDGSRFGVEANRVRESVWLPELTPIEEVPAYIVGMFCLRDQFIPVTDLNLRFGHLGRRYSLNDQLIILEYDQWLMGLIVSEVLEVVEVPLSAFRALPAADGGRHRLLTGEIRLGDEVISLLDVAQLIRQPDNLGSADEMFPARQFCPEATLEQQSLFHARAKALSDNMIEDSDSRLALAVVELDGEFFGIELDDVLEFGVVNHLCFIPCCPPHILGAISLRGSLLTLLNLAVMLNLAAIPSNIGKVVVVQFGGHRLGLAVNDIHDVVYLKHDALQAAPAILKERRGAEIKGTLAYADKMMVVLDLPALLARDEWLVNEMV